MRKCFDPFSEKVLKMFVQAWSAIGYKSRVPLLDIFGFIPFNYIMQNDNKDFVSHCFGNTIKSGVLLFHLSYLTV